MTIRITKENKSSCSIQHNTLGSLVSSSKKKERGVIPFNLKCLGASNRSFKSTLNAICNVNPIDIVPTIDHNPSIASFAPPIQKKAQFRLGSLITYCQIC